MSNFAHHVVPGSLRRPLHYALAPFGTVTSRYFLDISHHRSRRTSLPANSQSATLLTTRASKIEPTMSSLQAKPARVGHAGRLLNQSAKDPGENTRSVADALTKADVGPERMHNANGFAVTTTSISGVFFGEVEFGSREENTSEQKDQTRFTSKRRCSAWRVSAPRYGSNCRVDFLDSHAGRHDFGGVPAPNFTAGR
jgi:hypothetical protein